MQDSGRQRESVKRRDVARDCGWQVMVTVWSGEISVFQQTPKQCRRLKEEFVFQLLGDMFRNASIVAEHRLL